MKSISIPLLALLVGPVTDAAVFPEQLAPVCAPAASDMEKQLQDVFAVNDALCALYGDDDLTAQTIHAAAVQVRPACERLARLSPARLKQICLLADAVLWQRDWVYRVHLGETGVEMEPGAAVGLELFHLMAQKVQYRLNAPSVSGGEKIAWMELATALGGASVFERPGEWLHDRLATDYKTALTFFRNFHAAAALADDAQALPLLLEELATLNYLIMEGEAARIRVNHLAAAFCSAVKAVQGAPVPAEMSDQRQAMLKIYFGKLPGLRALCAPATAPAPAPEG